MPMEIAHATDVHPDAVRAVYDEERDAVVALRKERPRKFYVEEWPNDYHDADEPTRRLRTVLSHKDNALAAMRRELQ